MDAPKRLIAMTGLQGSVAVALEPILRELQMALACPRCLAAGEPDPFVSGANAPGDQAWTLACACTTRTIDPRTVQMLPPSGELVAGTRELFRGLDLEVRCPNRRQDCWRTPATMTRARGIVTVRCGCASHTFRPSGGSVPAAAVA